MFDTNNFEICTLKEIFKKIYGKENLIINHQFKRYEKLLEVFKNKFTETGIYLFSAPGRIEISGNHTDHNHGRVLAASVNLDSIAIAAKSKENNVVIHSKGYSEVFVVDLNDLAPKESEQESTFALIRGIASSLKELGYSIGGFKACIDSDVLPGSGLSSSAAIEILLGTIFNILFNEGKIKAEELALIGQFAENKYFNKPCGLMDQLTCAVGGILSIDFKNPQKPVAKKVEFDFDSQDYSLLVVDTGGNHADLTEDYASIPSELKAVANFFNKNVCRDVDYGKFLSEIKHLRNDLSDRAILRAYHFFNENERVLKQISALENENFDLFLELVTASGNSSFKWLQNTYTVKEISNQGISIALALTEDFIKQFGRGACRVHGGGFAGTILVFLPNKFVNDYTQKIENVFGEKSVLVLTIRSYGTLCLNDFMSNA